MKAQISTAAIFFVFLLIAAGFFYVMFSQPTSFQVMQGCEKSNIGIPCSEVQDCIDHFKDVVKAPDEWIAAQTFSCEQNSCYGIPSSGECSAVLVEGD